MSTTECSCKLCPSPGIYAVTSIWFERRTRAIFRIAEFGFLGVIVRTCVQTPRFWGDPRRREVLFFNALYEYNNAGAFTFFCFCERPFRTNWLIVGKERSSLSLFYYTS